MDFEDEEVFNETAIESEEENTISEIERLESLIEDATRRLEILNAEDEASKYSDDETLNSKGYSNSQLFNTMLIKDAAERLITFESKEVINTSEDISELSELAATIKSAAEELSVNAGKIEEPEYFDISDKYESEEYVEEGVVGTPWTKEVITSDVNLQTENNIYSVKGDFENKKVSFYPINNVAEFGKNEDGEYYIKAEHPGTCQFKMISENDESITTQNYNVNFIDNL